jgi:hypothetical protein
MWQGSQRIQRLRVSIKLSREKKVLVQFVAQSFLKPLEDWILQYFADLLLYQSIDSK